MHAQSENFDQQVDEIQDLGFLHHYRTELPNIIFDIALNPYEFRLYCHYKRIAGDSGRCFKSNVLLAKECGMSERQLIDVKKSLQIPREKLNGLSLISIQHRVKENGTRNTDLVKINNVWPENMLYFKESLPTARGAPGVVHSVHQGGAPGAYKEEPIKKNQIEELPPLPSVAKAAEPKAPTPKALEPKASKQREKVFFCLEKIKMEESRKLWLTKTYEEAVVSAAVDYATHPETKITTNIEAAIFFACKRGISAPKSLVNVMEERVHQASDLSKKMDRAKMDDYQVYCDVGHRGIEVGFKCGNCEPLQALYEDSKWDSKIRTIMDRFAIIFNGPVCSYV